MANNQRVKLSELIFQNTTPEKITDMQNERYLTVALYGKGVRERVIKEGKYPVPFTGYRVSEGQFIYSRIDARNGAYGIIEPEYDGFVVSKDFPVYDIDTSRIHSQFLLMSVLGGGFLRQVKNSSFGATNRMRIKEETLESYSIILPPMEEQSRIVEIISKAQCIIDRYQRQICILDDLIKARFVEQFGDIIQNTKRWPQYVFSDITTSRLGKMLDAKQQTGKYRFPYLANFNVQWFRFELGTLNEMDFDEDDQIEFELRDGDLIVCEGGEIGRCAVWHNQIQRCFFQKALHRVRCNTDIVLPDYLARWFQYNCEHGGFSTIEGAKATIAHLPGAKMKALIVPVPPIELQRSFLNYIIQVDKSKVVAQKALDEAKLLYESLMQKYFG